LIITHKRPPTLEEAKEVNCSFIQYTIINS
jgi:hypothetical protein